MIKHNIIRKLAFQTINIKKGIMKKIFVIVSFLLACSAGIVSAQSEKPAAAAKTQSATSDKKSEKACCHKGGDGSKSCSDKAAKASCSPKSNSEVKSEKPTDTKK